MNRRRFLGWLGGGVGAAAAVYSVSGDAYPLSENAARQHAASPKFVIKNESQKPMVVNYQSKRVTEDDHERMLRRAAECGHRTDTLSTILLPGEELTITAVEMQGAY